MRHLLVAAGLLTTGCVADTLLLEGQDLPQPLVLRIVTERIPHGETSQPYSADVLAVGSSSGMYQWSFEGDLPAPLAWKTDGDTATLKDTPAETGEFSVLVHVEDGNGQSDERRFDFIVGRPLAFKTTVLPDALIGHRYPGAAQIDSNNGVEPTTWSLVSGRLPPGLTLEPEGQLAFLRGVPNRYGRFEFVLRVSDALDRSIEGTFSVTVIR